MKRVHLTIRNARPLLTAQTKTILEISCRAVDLYSHAQKRMIVRNAQSVMICSLMNMKPPEMHAWSSTLLQRSVIYLWSGLGFLIVRHPMRPAVIRTIRTRTFYFLIVELAHRWRAHQSRRRSQSVVRSDDNWCRSQLRSIGCRGRVRMRPGDASHVVRRGGNFDAWEGNGRITTFPEMLLISGL